MGRGNRRFFKRFTNIFPCPPTPATFDKRRRKTAKPPIYKTWKTWYFDIGSFPISHPLGPHGACRRAAPFYAFRRDGAAASRSPKTQAAPPAPRRSRNLRSFCLRAFRAVPACPPASQAAGQSSFRRKLPWTRTPSCMVTKAWGSMAWTVWSSSSISYLERHTHSTWTSVPV